MIKSSLLNLSPISMIMSSYKTALCWCTRITPTRMRVMVVDNEMRAGACQTHRDAGLQHSMHSGCNNSMAHHPTWHSSRWGCQELPHYALPSSTCRRLTAFSMLRSCISPYLWVVTMLFSIAPLGSGCSPEATIASTRTALGRRCSIHCCVEFTPGSHFSQSSFCLLAGPPLNFTPLRNSQRFSQPLLHSPRLIMPRLRHRLRCRRGSTRARSTSRRRSPSNSGSPVSVSPQRASLRASNRRRTMPPHRPPSPPPSPSLHPSSTEPRAAVAAHLANPETALFHFPCLTSQPMVVATISVKFKELPQLGSSSISPGPQLRPPEADRVLRSDMQIGPSGAERDKQGGSSSGRPSIHMAQNDGAATANHAQDDEDYEFGCRIEEESPSDDYGI